MTDNTETVADDASYSLARVLIRTILIPVYLFILGVYFAVRTSKRLINTHWPQNSSE